MPDSTEATNEHKSRVFDLVHEATKFMDVSAMRRVEVAARLRNAAEMHDDSKLLDPEKRTFDIFGPRLKHLKYGSPEYARALAHMQEALDHHYTNNRHHPEHHGEAGVGIYKMDLLDLIEMLADWKAAGERHEENQGLAHSIAINAERFGYDERFAGLLTRTAERMGWLKP